VLTAPVSAPFPYTTLFRSQEAPVAHPADDALQALLELLPAGGPRAAHGQHVHAVLEAHAVVGERVVALAVVVLEPCEIIVGGLRSEEQRLNSSHVKISYAV